MTEQAKVVRWDDLDFDLVTEMVARKSIVAGDELVQSYLKKGALIPLHTHAEAQWICVQQGARSMVVGGATLPVKEGEVLRVPAGVPHQGEALDDTLVLDIRRGGVEFLDHEEVKE
jgi:quercetin dioxygenase-like cupin family protein